MLYDLCDVNVCYGAQKVLQNVNLAIPSGKIIGLVGPNGSGKTTLLNVLTGLKRPTSGEILLFDRHFNTYSLKERARCVAYLAQENQVHFGFSVLETVLLGRYPHLGAFALEGSGDLEKARESMLLCDLQGFENRLVSELSGGERQRVFLARALAQEPKVLILDEPTNFLDVKHQLEVCQMLQKLKAQKAISVIAVFHDLNLAALYCDELVVLKAGKVVTQGIPKDVFNAKLLRNVFDAEVYVDVFSGTQRPFYLPFELNYGH